MGKGARSCLMKLRSRTSMGSRCRRAATCSIRCSASMVAWISPGPLTAVCGGLLLLHRCRSKWNLGKAYACAHPYSSPPQTLLSF